MPTAQKLTCRESVGSWRDVVYYELDEADLDRKCAHVAQRLCSPEDRFLWFWFRPDVGERDEEVGWDRLPGLPLVQPPHPGETIQLPDAEHPELLRHYLVLRATRIRMDNYGWCVLREVR